MSTWDYGPFEFVGGEKNGGWFRRCFDWLIPPTTTIAINFDERHRLCDTCYDEAVKTVNNMFGWKTDDPYGYDTPAVVEQDDLEHADLVFSTLHRKWTRDSQMQLQQTLKGIISRHLSGHHALPTYHN